MLRRRLPSLLGLAAALGLLGWGLWALSQIFVQERAAAHAAVVARQVALAQYGRAALIRRLEAALAESLGPARAAEDDPLVTDEGLYLRVDDEVRLPRSRAARPGAGRAAIALYETLVDPQARPEADEPGSPWAERLALRARIMSGDGEGVERGFRALLAHRARFVVAAERDVPYMTALLTWFEGTGRADSALLRLLLHDGISDPRAGRVESLQRLVLRRRAAFTAPEFEFLTARIGALSDAARAPTARFRAEAERPSVAPPAVPAELSEPLLVGSGAWYVAPHVGQVRGVAVDLPALLADVTAEMYGGGLFGSADRLRIEPFEVRAARVLQLEAASPAWAQAIADAERAYRYKRGLVLLCGLLALCLAALAVLDQRRRRRYLALKSDFVSAVSHELRTPLAAVRVMAETLERRLVDDPRAKDYPTRIVRTIDGLSFLVENILSFNRLDKGRWVARRAPCSLRAVLTAVAAQLDELSVRPVAWRVTGAEADTVSADAELLQLLYMNLARNAALYNERDPVTLDVALEATDDAVVVRFRDNGVGIPEAAQRHIFTEFYRASTGARGSGLGLALCQRIMALHGGRVRLAATGPDGTTFELRHPRQP